MARAPHIGEVYAFVADVIRHRATDDWLADLARADIPAARLHAIEDLLDDEHLAATGFIRAQDHPPKAACARPRRWAATPARPPPSAAPPRAGQHSRELLAEAGYDEAAIDALFARGVALSPDSPEPQERQMDFEFTPDQQALRAVSHL